MNKLDIDREMSGKRQNYKKQNKTVEGQIIRKNLCQRNESVSFIPSNLVLTFLSGIRCTNCQAVAKHCFNFDRSVQKNNRNGNSTFAI